MPVEKGERRFGPKLPKDFFPVPFPPDNAPDGPCRSFEPSSLSLRPLEPKDLPGAMLLDTLCHQHHWSMSDMLDEICRPVSLSLGFFQGEGLLAMVIGWVIQPEFHVINLSVHPDFRRRGLGRCLMTLAMDFAFISQAPLCELETKRGYAAAEGLYASLGFVETGWRPSYYPDGSDAVLLSRGAPEAPAPKPRRKEA
jgi:ribosomal-protein-alanine N-acetyltransferase